MYEIMRLLQSVFLSIFGLK